MKLDDGQAIHRVYGYKTKLGILGEMAKGVW